MPDGPAAKRRKVALIDDDDELVPFNNHKDAPGAKYTVIDPDGDLKLVVGPKKATFLVDAGALRRQSPVFKAMLFGNFREAIHDADWTVLLPDDDSAGFELILNIIHCNLNRLPSKVKLNVLYNTVVVANKYDMIECVATRAKQWYLQIFNLSSSWSCNQSVKAIRGEIQRLWVLNETGNNYQSHYSDNYAIRKGMGMLASVLHSGEDGNLVYPRQSTEGVPEAIQDSLPDLADYEHLGRMEQERLKVVERYLEHMKAKLNDMISLTKLKAVDEVPLPVCDLCQSMVLGRMIQYLSGGQRDNNLGATSSFSLYPFPDPKDYQGSITDLSNRLKKIQSDLDMLPKCTHGKTRNQSSSEKHITVDVRVPAKPAIPRLDTLPHTMDFSGVKTRHQRKQVSKK